MVAPTHKPRVPPWASRATAALASAGARVRVIAANTPQNLRVELSRLEQAWATKQPAEPRFVYPPRADWTDTRRALLEVADALEGRGALGAIYAARAHELADEAALCEAAGSPALWAVARRRFARRDRCDADADATAEAWLREGAPLGGEAAASGELVRSDDPASPDSLFSWMRREIGRRRLPFRVTLEDNLPCLAATGDGLVQVVRGRWVSRRDVERTVRHELDGHAAPRVLGDAAPIGIFALGTARGSDDQEGRALLLEQTAGFLDAARRRELALRHVAARSVEAGADFVATVRLLLSRGAPLDLALRVAARVHRGGGLAREAVYLPALLRVEAAVARDRTIERVLRVGRVAVDAAPVLRRFV